MNTQLKLATSLAAILLVAVTGYSLLLNGGIGGPGTTPTVATTPTAQPAAAATPVPSAGRWPLWYTEFDTGMGFFPGSGILAAGSHTTTSFMPNFTFGVPAGWVNSSGDVDSWDLFPDTPANKAEYERSGLFAQSIVMHTFEQPSFTCFSAENNRGATAADMVTAITANQALATSGLVDVEIGGLTGKQLDVWRNPDWTGTCPDDSALPAGHDPEDKRVRVILLDALTTANKSPGVIVLSVRSMTSADFEAFLAEAMPIIQSFDFTPALREGPLSKGRYVFETYTKATGNITADVPAGWQGWGGSPEVDPQIVVGPGELDPPRVSVVFQVADGLHRDPCQWDTRDSQAFGQPGDVVVGPTAIDLANALQDSSSYSSTTPSPVVVGGYEGYELELRTPDDLNLEACDGWLIEGTHYYVVFSGEGTFPFFFGKLNRMHLFIADVGGTRVIATILYSDDTPSPEVEAALAIIDSVEFMP